MAHEQQWESIGDISARLVARLEEQQRRKFVRDCADDHVSRATTTKPEEREHA